MNYSIEQQSVIDCKENYQQVIAAAGSGKTFTMIALLEKVILTDAEIAEDILVITFSRKAALEIAHRLEKKLGKNSIRIQTFHAYCLYILQKYHPEYSQKKIEIIESKEKEEIFKKYLQEYRFLIGGIPYQFILEPTHGFLEKYFPDLKNKLDQIYSSYKKEHNKLDFDDLVSMYLSALKTKESWAMEAKKEVKRVIVDEFQDTDFTQLEWLQLIEPNKLTVVGDDWQAIYGFRGATTKPFLEFKNYFTPCSINYLNTNYRSLNSIVKTSAIPIRKNKNNIQKQVTPFRKGKGNVYKILLDSYVYGLPELIESINVFVQQKKEIMVLCRSNHRIAEYTTKGLSVENCITIHASKGLEFETVFLDLCSGWNADLSDKETMEEERRILYVGLSRAKNNLFIIGKSRRKNKPSIEAEFIQYFRWNVKQIPIERVYKQLSLLLE